MSFIFFSKWKYLWHIVALKSPNHLACRTAWSKIVTLVGLIFFLMHAVLHCVRVWSPKAYKSIIFFAVLGTFISWSWLCLFWCWRQHIPALKSIPCLLVHWLLKSPMHQQAWYWLCRTDNIYCCSRVNFIYLGQAKSNIGFKMWIYLL